MKMGMMIDEDGDGESESEGEDEAGQWTQARASLAAQCRDRPLCAWPEGRCVLLPDRGCRLCVSETETGTVRHS